MDRIKESPPGTRRKFDPTFKREAVRNWLASSKSAAVVSKELGLGEGLLLAWRKLLPQDDRLFFTDCVEPCGLGISWEKCRPPLQGPREPP